MDPHHPRPGPHHEQLARFVGEWVGEETLLPSAWSPEQQQRTSRVVGRMLEGFFLITDYEQRDGNDVTFRGHGVYSWDPNDKLFVMHWFDSMGGRGGVATGPFDDDVLTFESTSSMGHHRYSYTFDSDGGYTFEMAHSANRSVWTDWMRARFRRAT